MLLFTKLSLLIGSVLLFIDAFKGFLYRITQFEFLEANIFSNIIIYGCCILFFISFISSLINLFLSKGSKRSTNIFLLFITSALFIGQLSWLL